VGGPVNRKPRELDRRGRFVVLVGRRWRQMRNMLVKSMGLLICESGECEAGNVEDANSTAQHTECP
jgi:hypothetical protein